MIFFGNRTDVARFVDGMLRSSKVDSQLITIMPLGKSEAFCALTVTDTSLEDIVVVSARAYSLQLIDISLLNILVG